MSPRARVEFRNARPIFFSQRALVGEPNELQKSDRSYYLIPAYFLGLRVITMGKMTWISHQAWTPHIATVRAAPRISSQSVEAVAECFPRNESKRCSIKSCRRLLNASTFSILPKTNSWTEARWTLNYHLTYLYVSYHCLIIVLSCLIALPSTLTGTGTQQVFAFQLPSPRLVCRKDASACRTSEDAKRPRQTSLEAPEWIFTAWARALFKHGTAHWWNISDSVWVLRRYLFTIGPQVVS